MPEPGATELYITRQSLDRNSYSEAGTLAALPQKYAKKTENVARAVSTGSGSDRVFSCKDENVFHYALLVLPGRYGSRYRLRSDL